jgi:heme a synthase
VPPQQQMTSHNPWLNRLAWMTAIATFPLIFLGGLVTSHGAGMSVPDWPNSYGYNMFTFPPSQWIGGIFYEHTHRLLGTVVGLAATLVYMVAWGRGHSPTSRKRLLVWGALALAATTVSSLFEPTRRIYFHLLFGYAAFVLLGSIACRNPDPRLWVRRLSTAVLIGVIVQGLLGGLRVVLVHLDLAVIHGCFAQAYFCLLALMIVVTSRWWHANEPGAPTHAGRTLATLSIVGVVLVFGQLVLGATMRHYRAGLAIPDLPLAYGSVLPPMTGEELEAANKVRAWELNLEPVSLVQVWLHFSHRVMAVVVSVALVILEVHVLRRHRRHRGLVVPGVALVQLLAIQLGLGIFTVMLRKPADIASLHVAVGALVLVTTFVICARALRLYGRAGSLVPEAPPGKDEPAEGNSGDRRSMTALVPA